MSTPLKPVSREEALQHLMREKPVYAHPMQLSGKVPDHPSWRYRYNPNHPDGPCIVRKCLEVTDLYCEEVVTALLPDGLEYYIRQTHAVPRDISKMPGVMTVYKTQYTEPNLWPVYIILALITVLQLSLLGALVT